MLYEVTLRGLMLAEATLGDHSRFENEATLQGRFGGVAVWTIHSELSDGRIRGVPNLLLEVMQRGCSMRLLCEA